MPNMSVELYDDWGAVVVTKITVVCGEAEAQYLERLMQHTKFRAMYMPQHVSHNMTFRQFKEHFIEHHRHSGGQYTVSTKP